MEAVLDHPQGKVYSSLGFCGCPGGQSTSIHIYPYLFSIKFKIDSKYTFACVIGIAGGELDHPQGNVGSSLELVDDQGAPLQVSMLSIECIFIGFQ